MSYSKSFTALLVMIACTAAMSADAGQRSRGRAPSRGSTVVGRAAPRTLDRGRIAPRIMSPRGGRVPYRPYSYPYRSGLRTGFSAGYGYPYGYRYPYGYSYGYPYGYAYGYSYGYPYGYPYGSPYGSYGYPYGSYGYGLPPAGYVSAVPGAAYGGVRIQGAPEDAQVFADGYYVGVADDFDGAFQHLNLQAGPHRIEIQVPGREPIAFDVNVRPGETVTYHADVR